MGTLWAIQVPTDSVPALHGVFTFYESELESVHSRFGCGQIGGRLSTPHARACASQGQKSVMPTSKLVLAYDVKKKKNKIIIYKSAVFVASYVIT